LNSPPFMCNLRGSVAGGNALGRGLIRVAREGTP